MALLRGLPDLVFRQPPRDVLRNAALRNPQSPTSRMQVCAEGWMNFDGSSDGRDSNAAKWRAAHRKFSSRLFLGSAPRGPVSHTWKRQPPQGGFPAVSEAVDLAAAGDVTALKRLHPARRQECASDRRLTSNWRRLAVAPRPLSV